MLERWRGHLRAATGKRAAGVFAKAIKEYGADAFTHEVIEACATLHQANAAEERWIRELDTRNPARGFNMHSRLRSHVPQTRDAVRARMSAAAKARWADPTRRAAILAAQRAEGVSEKRRANGKAQWKDPKTRRGNRLALKGSHTTEGIARTQAALRNPHVRARQAEAIRAALADPETKAKMKRAARRRQRKLWADPNYRAHMSEVHRKP
jgi:hypothetical protein